MDEGSFVKLYNKYFKMVYQISYQYMSNSDETEDIVQEVFIKLYNTNKHFESEEHIKSWLIRVTTNQCINKVKHWSNKTITYEDEVLVANTKKSNLLSIIKTLPNNYKTVIYMYYYMGYQTNEIAHILHKNESTIRSLLKRARDKVKEMRGELNE